MNKAKDLGHLIQPMQDFHKDYLKDESRLSGMADSISFPESEKQVQLIVNHLIKQKIPITIQGSRTGITGGAVPLCGHILNLSKMNRITGLELDPEQGFSIRVQPGVHLSELNDQLFTGRFDKDGWDNKALEALVDFKKAGRFFWPPDPTERSASIGGIAANNSRGICSFHYGPARLHIKNIRVVDTNGDIHTITRGQYISSKGFCPLPGGRQLVLDPAIFQGQYSHQLSDPFDLMDLYLGSEGMLGVITELTLSLRPSSKELWGIVFFFEHQPWAIDFIFRIKPGEKRQGMQSHADIAAIEFMDQTTLECINDYKQESTRLKGFPDLDKTITTAVYVEIHGNSVGTVETLSGILLETAAQCGADPDNTWAFCNDVEIQQPHIFLHAAAESVHFFIDKARLKDQRITKLGMNIRLQNIFLSDVFEMVRKDLLSNELKAAIFGHAACEKLDINLLPQDYQQFDKGKRLLEEWSKKIQNQKGRTVSAPGVGKLKKALFGSIPLPQRLNLICRVKQQLDPDGLWNPGNLHDLQE